MTDRDERWEIEEQSGGTLESKLLAARRIKLATYATQEKALRDAGWVLVGTPETGEWVPPLVAKAMVSAEKKLSTRALARDPTCRLCGLADNLERSQYGWVHESCLMADDADTDYEALGYPETEQWSASSELAAHVRVGMSSWSLLSEMGLVQKVIRSDTDNG